MTAWGALSDKWAILKWRTWSGSSKLSTTSIPAQVADVILWHVRRAKSGTLDSDGKRYARMIDGGGDVLAMVT